jgi:GNAT superfamily N-acetyltransferase
MMNITFQKGHLNDKQDSFLLEGFDRHSAEESAPPYIKDRLNWLVGAEGNSFTAILTADVYWDWMHIDELWVEESHRGQGIGKTLMQKAEEYAIAKTLSGLWLWTQSWQAPKFYEKLGYAEFTRFEDLPKGHTRIGYRKKI